MGSKDKKNQYDWGSLKNQIFRGVHEKINKQEGIA